MVSGSPASGKTTLATALAAVARYVLIDLDTVTGPLTHAALRASGEDESAIDTRAARYDTLIDVAAANLEIGLGVVIAAPFTRERSSPRRFEHVVRKLREGRPHAEVALVYIDAPADLVRQRLTARNAPRDRAKLSRAPTRKHEAPLVPGALVLDGSQSLADQLARVLDALARPSGWRTNQPRADLC